MDLYVLETNLMNEGLPMGDIVNNHSVVLLSNNISMIVTEMIAMGCPPNPAGLPQLPLEV